MQYAGCKSIPIEAIKEKKVEKLAKNSTKTMLPKK